jgi:hypothetical protein
MNNLLKEASHSVNEHFESFSKLNNFGENEYFQRWEKTRDFNEG